MSSPRVAWVAVLLCAAVVTGCGQRIVGADGGVDGGTDAGTDGGHDGGDDGGFAPETAITAGPDALTASSEATFEFGSETEGATFQCALDESGYIPCASPLTLTGIDEGLRTFRVRASLEGVVDPSPATHPWTVDLSAPQTTLTRAPPPVSNETSEELTFTADEEVTRFECRLVPDAFEPCTSPHTLSGLIDRSYTFEVRAVDLVLRTDGSPATVTWTVDTTLPDTVLDATPPLLQAETSAEFAFSSTVAGATFECSFDDVVEACTSPKSYASIDPGEHTFTVAAIDGPERDPSPAEWTFTVSPGATRIRIAAANISTSGQQYAEPGTRILQALAPDVVLIQEFNISSSLGSTDTWVDDTFGTGFYWFREPTAGDSGPIPNGVISRFPIVASGEWTQPTEEGAGETRDFAWAQIELPGSADLWVVSLHLATTDGDRPNEATELVAQIEAAIPPGDFLVLGGDLNTDSRTESALTTLSEVVDIAGPWPVDQAGNGDTNANRNSPYDWVLTDSDLRAFEVAVEIGENSYPNGLVFDTRVYTPLTDVPPALQGDSGAVEMQHMAVVREFVIPGE